MKKLFIVLLLISCGHASEQKKQEDLKAKIEPVLHKYLSASNLGHIDSIIILTIESLTQKKEDSLAINHYLWVIDNKAQIVDLSIQEAKLWKSLDELSSQSRSNVTSDKIEKVNVLVKELNVLKDEMLKMRIEYEKADTIKSKGYLVMINCKYSDTLTLVQTKADSISIMVTPDFKIIEAASLMKNKNTPL